MVDILVRVIHRVALDPPPEEITREYVYEIYEVIREYVVAGFRIHFRDDLFREASPFFEKCVNLVAYLSGSRARDLKKFSARVGRVDRSIYKRSQHGVAYSARIHEISAFGAHGPEFACLDMQLFLHLHESPS